MPSCSACSGPPASAQTQPWRSLAENVTQWERGLRSPNLSDRTRGRFDARPRPIAYRAPRGASKSRAVCVPSGPCRQAAGAIGQQAKKQRIAPPQGGQGLKRPPQTRTLTRRLRRIPRVRASAADPGTRPAGFSPAPAVVATQALGVPAPSARAYSGSRDPAAHALAVLHSAGSKAAQAKARAGLDGWNCAFFRRGVQVFKVTVAVFDLLAAAAATVATLGYARHIAVVAGLNLRKAGADLLGPLPAPGGRSGTPAPHPPPVAGSGAGRTRWPELIDSIKKSLKAHQVVKEHAQLDLAKENFALRLAGAGAAALTVGLGVGVVIATGGAALAVPGLILSTLLLRQACANAHCAWKNRIARQNGLEPLPMGSSALANALYEYYTKDGAHSAQAARGKSTKVAAAVSLAITSAVVGISFGMSVALLTAIKAIRLGSSFIQGVLVPMTDFIVASRHRDDLQRRYEKTASEIQTFYKAHLRIDPSPLQMALGPAALAISEGMLERFTRALADWNLQGGNPDELEKLLGKFREGADEVWQEAARKRSDAFLSQEVAALGDFSLAPALAGSFLGWVKALSTI